MTTTPIEPPMMDEPRRADTGGVPVDGAAPAARATATGGGGTAAAPADALTARVVRAVGDRYVGLREIGRGGMAVVYAARERRLPRDVALKVLPPDLAYRAEVKERFMREAQTAARLNHANIVPIYAVDDADGIAWITMALIDGESVAERLQREPPLSTVRVRDILVQVADALAYAHASGVVHRDIKPDNILLERSSGRAVVTDFGIAHAAEAGARLTQTGIAVGTPAFMSPEQALGERDVDGRADVYSLAVVAHVMLAGRLPYEAASTPAMLLEHVHGTPRRLGDERPDLPAEFVAIITKAMARQRESRWSNAREFADALRETPLTASAVGSASVRAAPAAPAAPADAARPVRPPRPAPSATAPVSPPPDAPLSREEQRRRAVAADVAADAAARAALPAIAPFPPLPPARFDDTDARAAERAGGRSQSVTDDYRREEDRRRIRAFRMSVVRSAFLVFVLALINAEITHGEPWFLIPSFFIGLGLLQQFGRMYEDGIGVFDVLRGRRKAQALRPVAERAEDAVRRFRASVRRVGIGAIGTVGSIAIGATYNLDPMAIPAVGFGLFGLGNVALTARNWWRLRRLGISGVGALGSGWRDQVEDAEEPPLGMSSRRVTDDRDADAAPRRRGRRRERAAIAAASPAANAGAAATRAGPGIEDPSRYADAEVLASPYGPDVRRAVDDRFVIRRTWGSLTQADREIVPDVEPTADALFERAISLATSLARLEGAVDPDAIRTAEHRIAQLQAEAAATPDRDRRLQLLQRQVQSLRELDGRRDALAAQLERATLALHTLRLDVVKLRALGVGAAIGDVTSATQEARALSKDIARALDVADEVRGV